jgi:hypothetical protein
MRNVPNKCVEKIQIHILYSYSITFSRKSCHLWDNVGNVPWGRPQMTIWRMRIACWITKATNTHSEYITTVFPLQKWLHESTSMLRHPYICLSTLALHEGESPLFYLRCKNPVWPRANNIGPSERREVSRKCGSSGSRFPSHFAPIQIVINI